MNEKPLQWSSGFLCIVSPSLRFNSGRTDKREIHYHGLKKVKLPGMAAYIKGMMFKKRTDLRHCMDPFFQVHGTFSSVQPSILLNTKRLPSEKYQNWESVAFKALRCWPSSPHHLAVRPNLSKPFFPRLPPRRGFFVQVTWHSLPLGVSRFAVCVFNWKRLWADHFNFMDLSFAWGNFQTGFHRIVRSGSNFSCTF